MKVFVAGATGVAGRRAVRDLAAAGHEVTGVARGPEKAKLVESLGASPLAVDLFDPEAVRAAVAGHEVVVNLATKIPSVSRTLLSSAWQDNDRIRTEVSKNLVDAALEVGAVRYMQESLAFMYPDGGDDWIDETVAVDPPPHARSTLVAEDHTARFTRAGGTGIVLRFGQFYAAESPHTQFWFSTARRGVSPFPGPTEAFTPLIAADDIGGAVVAALSAPAGTYNVVDNEPLRQSELAEVLAAAVGVERLRFPPTGLTRLGGKKIRMLMRSHRVSNRALREATGWEPRYPSAREGFPVVGAAIEGAGS